MAHHGLELFHVLLSMLFAMSLHGLSRELGIGKPGNCPWHRLGGVALQRHRHRCGRSETRTKAEQLIGVAGGRWKNGRSSWIHNPIFDGKSPEIEQLGLVSYIFLLWI